MTKLFVIDDDTQSHIWQPPTDIARGLDLGLRGTAERAYEGLANPFPKDLAIDPSEYQARIAERKARKATTRAMLEMIGVKRKNQSNVNYCWIFAPTRSVEIENFKQSGLWTNLSPSSAGAQIKNYRNVGGWGKEGLEWIVEKGLVPSQYWADTAWNDRSLATPENLARALRYRCTKWIELQPRNLNQLVSLLLQGFTVPIGLNWWGHEVLAIDVEWINGAIAIVFENSWGDDWGDKGFGVLQGQRMYPDDAVSPVNMISLAA